MLHVDLGYTYFICLPLRWHRISQTKPTLFAKDFILTNMSIQSIHLLAHVRRQSALTTQTGLPFVCLADVIASLGQSEACQALELGGCDWSMVWSKWYWGSGDRWMRVKGSWQQHFEKYCSLFVHPPRNGWIEIHSEFWILRRERWFPKQSLSLSCRHLI